MRLAFVAAFFAITLWGPGARAEISSDAIWCTRGDGAACTDSELADPVRFRQIVILPTGFTVDDEALFRSEFANLVATNAKLPTGNYAADHQDHILYIGFWLPGGVLGTPEANFHARVSPHPVRGKALAITQSEVIAAIDALMLWQPRLAPWGVGALFNSTELHVTASTAPPGFLGKPYGVAKFSRSDIAGAYVSVHELAHATLNFVDEYTEDGLQGASISTLDYLTPLAVAGQDWGSFLGSLFGISDYRVSEILASNGTDNVDVTRYPSRVATTGYASREYEYESGMFFGHGTFHARGRNLMNDDTNPQGPDDGFGWAHSPPQLEVVEEAFNPGGRAPRPNDRLRAAGPVKAWPAAWGSRAHLLAYDADKNHHYHPTSAYDVQVGWYERHWKVCWAAIIPYPCHTDQWVTAEKRFTPASRVLHLKTSSLYGLAGLVQKIACGLGIKQVHTGKATFDLCSLTVDQMANAFIPTFDFPLPYQELEVPATQWMTTYHWRFRSENGTFNSGYTAWMPFIRVF
jgi:hypothetical protein